MTMQLGLVPYRRDLNVYEMRNKSISDRIVNLLLSIDIADFSISKAWTVRRKVSEQVAKMNEYAVSFSKRTIPKSYDRSQRAAKLVLQSVGLRVRPEREGLHEQAIEDLQTSFVQTIVGAGGRIKNFAERWIYLVNEAAKGLTQLQEFGGVMSQATEEEILDIVAEGVLESSSRQSVAALVKDKLRYLIGDGNLIDINGRMYRVDKYSMLVARTEMRNSQSKAIENECARYAHDLVEISDHGTETDICKPYEGGIFSISGESTEWPQLDEWPPFHPNCQHFAMPYVGG